MENIILNVSRFPEREKMSDPVSVTVTTNKTGKKQTIEMPGTKAARKMWEKIHKDNLNPRK